MSVLMILYGWNHLLTQMSWFFTKAALLTFGGAYAVLPYVYQGAVSHYDWLTPTQMIDGLALGETTPGPLIMVVAFVGFVGAYVNAPLGPAHLFFAGAIAASLVTWFTFLPSFLFILAGGPLVESTHNDLKFTAPLTAITAAVVGAIINLALFFGYHVLWPAGFAGTFDGISALIALGAALALFRFKAHVIAVIAACAVVGLLVRLALKGIKVTDQSTRVGEWQRIEHSLLDVRRKAVRAADAADLPNSMWLDPEQVFAWKDEIPRDRPAVVYCAKGHEISQGVAATLCALGLDARYLVDGYAGWRAAQMPVHQITMKEGEQT
jgi:chromate transport protein ChrA